MMVEQQQSNYLQLSNVHFQKQEIHLNHHIISDVIYLENSMIIKTIENKLLYVKVQRKRNIQLKEVLVPFEVNNRSKILPYGQQSFLILNNSYFVCRLRKNTINTKTDCIEIEYKEIQSLNKSIFYLKLFHQSNNVIELSDLEKGNVSQIGQKKLNNIQYIAIGDSKSIFVNNITETQVDYTISFMDLNYQNNIDPSEIIISKQQFPILLSPTRLFVLQNRNVIIGNLEDEILTIFQIDTSLKNCKKLLTLQNIQFCKFSTINTMKQKMIIFIKKRFENQQKMLLINYKNGQILHQFLRPQIVQNSQKRWNKDLQNYAEIKQEKGEKKLIHYFLPQIRKIYFNLFTKSKLKSSFGQGLFKPLLKLILN